MQSVFVSVPLDTWNFVEFWCYNIIMLFLFMLILLHINTSSLKTPFCEWYPLKRGQCMCSTWIKTPYSLYQGNVIIMSSLQIFLINSEGNVKLLDGWINNQIFGVEVLVMPYIVWMVYVWKMKFYLRLSFFAGCGRLSDIKPSLVVKESFYSHLP